MQSILIKIFLPASLFIIMVGMGLVLNIASMILGIAVALLAKLEKRQAITISLEVGLQNGATAMLITGTILNNAVMAISPSVYSFIMFFTAAALAYSVKRFMPEST